VTPPPSLRWTTDEQPVASVIVPVYGQLAATVRCLDALVHHGATTPFEVVVVDDASPDDSAAVLDGVPGLRLVRLADNRGYSGAVSAGVREARGRLLVLLNNDTEVRGGWLDALVDVAEADPSVGLVGAALVQADGSLQEVGGVVFSDGSAANVGRGGDPGDPRWRTRREVDYCSAAAMLVRRSAWDEVGGFDRRFAPAYYEDTDLAFALRAAGWRVLVEPAAQVVHHEGTTHGTDTGTGGKQGQARNRSVFAVKWASTLATRPAPAPDMTLAMWRPTARGHAVVFDHKVPEPDQDSGSVRMDQLLGLLQAAGYTVHLVPAELPLPPHARRLQEQGIDVRPDGQGRELLMALAPELDLVVLSRLPVALAHLADVRDTAPGAHLVYDTVDLAFLREGRRAELEDDDDRRRSAAALRELELALVRTCDATLVVSPYEQRVLQEAVPGAHTWLLPNVHPVVGARPGPEERDGLLFVGSYQHPPNVDAARWAARAVLPLVRARRPGARLRLVGNRPPPALFALSADGDRDRAGAGDGAGDGAAGIDVMGWVADLRPLHDSARVLIAPLRYGAGVKGKIGEALSVGLPVVTTPVGAEGMGLVHGETALIAAGADAFAEAVLQVCDDDALWSRLSRQGRALAVLQWSPRATARTLAELLASLDRRRDSRGAARLGRRLFPGS